MQHTSRHDAAPVPALRPLVAALCSALLGLGIVTAALSPATSFAADASAASSKRHFSIPAGALSQSLYSFASSAGITLSFDPALTDGLRSSGLNGNYAVADGLATLLAGSGLEAVPGANGGYLLRKQPDASEAVLPSVTVRTSTDATTEGRDSYTTGSMSTATGLALSQRHTPQSISVVTRQQMDDFNLSTLQDIAKATPGITVKSQAITDQETTFHARGFALQHVNVDGLPLDVTGFNERNVSADLSMYDRVEVVRGASGLLEGAGTPSGSINLVRKRPTAAPLLNLAAGVGSWGHKQLGIDASRALNDSGTLRGRVVGAWRDSDSFVDVTNTHNGMLYGIVEADLTSSTTLGIGAHVQRTRTDSVFEGLPTYSDGSHMNLPRSTHLGVQDSFQKRDNDTFFADLEHRFDNGWTLKASGIHIEADSDSRYSVNSRIAGSETTLDKSESGWRYGTEQTVLDVRAKGPVTWFGRQHELVVGANYRKDDSTAAQTWDGAGGTVIDIYNWNANAHRLAGSAPTDPLLWGRNTREKGLYAAGNFNLAEQLHLILGGRFGWYTQNTTGWYNGSPTWKRSLDESAEFVPYAGLTYDLDRNHSVYASVTEIFQPQSSIDVNGNTLDPLTGTNYELGIKGEYFGGALNTSAAVFRIKQRNRAVRDEANCPSTGAITCSRAAGEVESDGVDLQVFGTLLPGWQLSAGYTYVSAKYTQDAIASNIGQRISTDEPRHLFKLYTNYRLPGKYSQWSVNGSVQSQSRIYRSETGYYTAQGTHAIVGVGAAYKVNERLQLQLNVDNLFDRHYYTNLGYSWSGGGARYGTPRNFLLTARYSFF